MSNSQISHSSFINAKEDIVDTFDANTGVAMNTNRFLIHYGKNGTQIVSSERNK